jgi:ankyrin repeat protein
MSTIKSTRRVGVRLAGAVVLFMLGIQVCQGVTRWVATAELRDALTRNDYPACQQLIRRGARPDTRSPLGKTALLLACQRGDFAFAETLLSQHASVNTPDAFGSTPLLEACYLGHAHLINALLRDGADVRARNRQTGQTALLGVAMSSHPSRQRADIALDLLDRGASINAQDELGRTPLMWAVLKDDARLVRLLIGRGARLDLRYYDGSTVLDIALDPRSGPKSAATLSLIREAARRKGLGRSNAARRAMVKAPIR